jgi:hypothetical protein
VQRTLGAWPNRREAQAHIIGSPAARPVWTENRSIVSTGAMRSGYSGGLIMKNPSQKSLA